jgi:hypothetical protein
MLRVLVCEPEVTVCEIIDRLVICGTRTGTIQVWDLSEMNQTDLDDSSTFQRPSYATDGIHNDHQDAINLLLINQPSRQSYYLKTVDVNLGCCSWIINAIREDVNKAYDLDYGMKIGSSIGMRKTNSIKLKIPNRAHNINDCKITASCQISGDSFLAGLDSGALVLISDHREYPDCFFINSGQVGPKIANKIQINPFDNKIFLVSCNSGGVVLFRKGLSAPLSIWNFSEPIKSFEWSSHRPSVFYVLDSQYLHAWDILENETSPMISTECSKLGSISTLRCHPDPSLSGHLKASRSLVLGSEDGYIQVHQLHASWTEPVVDELKEFAEYTIGLISKTKVRNPE